MAERIIRIIIIFRNVDPWHSGGVNKTFFFLKCVSVLKGWFANEVH